MKVTIELTDNEVKGIKAYLKSTDSGFSKQDVKDYIQGVVKSTIYAPAEAVSDYISIEQ
jgi:hypothetical protein